MRDTLIDHSQTRKSGVNALHHLSWQDQSETHTSVWQSEAGQPPPKQVIIVDDTMTGDAAYWRACAGTAMLYAGDFQNAKQLLQAVTRRADRKPAKPMATMLEAFHQHRARQIGRANITNRILIQLHEGKCVLNRSPDMLAAVEGALGTAPPASMVLSLRETLGMIGAHEWRKKGVPIAALGTNIHAHYGVFAPVRNEYLDLINTATLNRPQVAWDIGTGTAVIAALLVARGVPQVIGTDNSARAVVCAAENIQRLEMQSKIQLVEADLFPDGQADLIVCNPPWIPAKVNTPMERSIYDPNSQMLRGFLSGVGARLTTNGEAWLVMSNLSENIGLRAIDELPNWIAQAGLTVIQKLDTSPTHAKSDDQSDPLYAARSQEVTSLYRLQAAGA